MKLRNFFKLKINEDEENKKKVLLDDEEKTDEQICEQEASGCPVCQKEVCECGMTEQEQLLLDDEVDEQNTTAAIAGYNMPLGAGRPSVTDQNKLPKDYYKPSDKKAIKSLDSGPNPDRTYKKYKWSFENKKVKGKKINEQTEPKEKFIDTYIMLGDKKVPIKIKLVNMGFGTGRIEINYGNKSFAGSQMKYEAGVLKATNLTSGTYRFKGV